MNLLIKAWVLAAFASAVIYILAINGAEHMWYNIVVLPLAIPLSIFTIMIPRGTTDSPAYAAAAILGGTLFYGLLFWLILRGWAALRKPRENSK